MKNILITGAGSYIGVNVEKYLLKWPDEYHVDSLNMIGEALPNWRLTGWQ